MAKNNKARFFYVLYSDKTWVFDQSERALYPIYIIMIYNAHVLRMLRAFWSYIELSLTNHSAFLNVAIL